MKRLSTILHLLLLTACLSLPSLSRAQEPILQSGQTFGMRLSGVPADEMQLVSQSLTISDAGTIRLPYLKTSIKAAGLKPSALARLIEATYKKAEIYTNPTIQISLTDVRSEQFVSVIGEVQAGKTVTFITGMTMLDAIAQCGGFTDFGNRRHVKLTRGKKITYHDLRSGDPKENVKLEPKDIITVNPGRTPR